MKISQAIKNAFTAITSRFIFMLDADESNRLSKGRILFIVIALSSVLWVDTASAARFTCCVCRQFSGSTVTQTLCMTSRERNPDDQAAQATATEACERYDSMGADFSCYSTQNSCDATTDCATATRASLNEPATQFTNCCVLSPIGGSGAKVCLESNPHSAGDSDRNRAADQRCRGLTATGAEYDNYTYRLYRNTRCRSTGLREQCGTASPLSLGESAPTGAIVGEVAAAVDRPCAATENCPTGQTCQAGICVASSGGGCETNADCTSGLECRQVDPSSARKECMASAPAAEPEVPFEPIIPELGVTIPGLNFSAPERDGGVVTVNFIATYINAAYRYISAIGLVVAIVMVVYGGFIYLVGSAGMSSIQRGKKIITDAIIGMLLILSAYTILNLINPATVNLTSLELSFVEYASTPEAEVLADTSEEVIADSTTPPPTTSPMSSSDMDYCRRLAPYINDGTIVLRNGNDRRGILSGTGFIRRPSGSPWCQEENSTRFSDPVDCPGLPTLTQLRSITGGRQADYDDAPQGVAINPMLCRFLYDVGTAKRNGRIMGEINAAIVGTHHRCSRGVWFYREARRNTCAALTEKRNTCLTCVRKIISGSRSDTGQTNHWDASAFDLRTNPSLQRYIVDVLAPQYQREFRQAKIQDVFGDLLDSYSGTVSCSPTAGRIQTSSYCVDGSCGTATTKISVGNAEVCGHASRFSGAPHIHVGF